jgi:phosphoribosylanthranilate isomerase
MHIKICGITNAADAEWAARHGADFLGLILANSPRRLTLKAAHDILAALPSGPQPVLLFRDAPLEEVLTAVTHTGCRWVQLHGRESVAYLQQLRATRRDLHLIKAWEVADPAAGPALTQYLHHVCERGVTPDVILLDAPKGGPHPGYDVLAEVAAQVTRRPPAVWLAGGLNPGNVCAAAQTGQYDGVDVASGVERRPGLKDPDAVRQFIEEVRAECGGAD